MTLAQYSRQAGRKAEGLEAVTHPGGAVHERPHPGPAEYARIGIALAIVTAIEVGVYYLDIGTTALVAVLLILSGIKFSLVASWFMHLWFDRRIFSTLFVAGLALAFAVFIVVLATLGAGLL